MLYHSTINFKNNIYSEYLGESILNLLDKTFQIPEHYSYNVFKVTKEYIARPDLIALDAYGDSSYCDVICKLNGISNPFELNEDMLIIVPSPECVMDFVKRPDSNEMISSITQPTQKAKQTKRQPNESVLGDSRFKIDSVNGVIIY